MKSMESEPIFVIQRVAQKVPHAAEPDVVRSRDPLQGFDSLLSRRDDENLEAAVREQLPVAARGIEIYVPLELLSQDDRTLRRPVDFDEGRAAIELDPSVRDVPEFDRLLP